MNRLPNLLIIGAQKCGTTWLHDRLSQHSKIFMSDTKELNFFSGEQLEARAGQYAANFADATGKAYAGESTPGYFWSYDPASEYLVDGYPHANRAIPRAVRSILGGNVKLILSLRNPVHRAVSAYLHHFRMGRVPYSKDLLTAGRSHGILDIGFYRRHFLAWHKIFGSEAIKVVFLDDIERNGQSVLDALFGYLNLPPEQILGANEPFHVGFALTTTAQGLTVSQDDDRSARHLARLGLTPDKRPVITEMQLTQCHELYRRDIEFVMNELGGGHLNWLERPRLSDFT